MNPPVRIHLAEDDASHARCGYGQSEFVPWQLGAVMQRAPGWPAG